MTGGARGIGFDDSCRRPALRDARACQADHDLAVQDGSSRKVADRLPEHVLLLRSQSFSDLDANALDANRDRSIQQFAITFEVISHNNTG